MDQRAGNVLKREGVIAECGETNSGRHPEAAAVDGRFFEQSGLDEAGSVFPVMVFHRKPP